MQRETVGRHCQDVTTDWKWEGQCGDKNQEEVRGGHYWLLTPNVNDFNGRNFTLKSWGFLNTRRHHFLSFFLSFFLWIDFKKRTICGLQKMSEKFSSHIPVPLHIQFPLFLTFCPNIECYNQANTNTFPSTKSIAHIGFSLCVIWALINV
jgi:hypothetical protein